MHKVCKNSFQKRCDLGVCRVSILPPTYVNTVSSDGFIRASRAPNTSPLVVFVNSKSGDNQVFSNSPTNPANASELTCFTVTKGRKISAQIQAASQPLSSVRPHPGRAHSGVSTRPNHFIRDSTILLLQPFLSLTGCDFFKTLTVSGFSSAAETAVLAGSSRK